ncbi:sn-glycerol-1-phosphate dehydrogenase [Clostridium uliginosum]|uniref:Glycerol-1-phosphate dehydrogenase [NAD(P)+] n=1 Tax=Clostridium uliginosum TaxID=119641 RepID=A0A1I1QHS4_9CLOT|nr:sn-glycerol-1-phosphate dehydrogenase [Clostridium uliginosum]SFD21595.1 glycerol-1-phosphate dehydrogenase [NAD(P)+] [Clostridium uliginosum]
MELNINNVSKLEINDFLKGVLQCKCGKPHSIGLEHVLIENNAIKKLPSILRELGFKKALVIADNNTYKAAGKYVESVLNAEKFNHKNFIFPIEDDLVPDESAVGKLFMQYDKEIDVIVTIGSGTLNDLGKYVSYKLGISSVIVATAPSMDGFASNGSALIVGNLKTTYPVEVPKAIIGDVNILKEAPMEMILAGFGDIVGKYSALNDWLLSKIINKEYYCDVTVKMVNDSIQKCMDNSDGMVKRDETAIKNLMEGLVLTGIAMSFVENSRPASGSEHHLAHYLEMMFLFEGKKAILHGTKVGIATIITTKLREIASKHEIDFDKVIEKAKAFDESKWQEDIKKYYKKAAPGIIQIVEKEDRNSIEDRLQRINTIKENIDEIRKIISNVPSADEIKAILEKVGAASHPTDVGVDNQTLLDGIIMAKEVRSRYTILNFLGDLELLEEFAPEVTNYLNGGEK